ncbi:MAG: Xaa-Pro peptidase family protein [Actinomycetia bacterium]|nr:Xaa-Pro peptidase family protein [Actinomycetes bacterium]
MAIDFTFRVKRLKKYLSNRCLDNIIVLKTENIYYLTGFYGKDSNSILIISEEKTTLLVNFIFYEDALTSVRSSNIEVILYKNDRMKETAELLSALKPKRVIIEDSGIEHRSFIKLGNLLEKSGKNLIADTGIVESLRLVKDECELENIKKACRITDLAFEKITELSYKRISKHSELSLGIEIERLLIKNGGYGRSFDFVIAGGSNSSKPHYLSEHLNIEGDVLLMDFGTVYNRYCSDITRTIFLRNGPFASKLKEIYSIVLEAQFKAIGACREGIRCDELDRIARKHIERSGYGKEFGHGLGHGVGLEVHENPALTGRNRTVLMENMVVTIEPGIYIPGLGGVRIEDMVVVKKNGCENLYKSKKDFTFLS